MAPDAFDDVDYGDDVRFRPHALERMAERGATEEEVIATVQQGERSPARFGRECFRRNFAFGGMRRGRTYANKQIEAIAVHEAGSWVVITVIVRYY